MLNVVYVSARAVKSLFPVVSLLYKPVLASFFAISLHVCSSSLHPMWQIAIRLVNPTVNLGAPWVLAKCILHTLHSYVHQSSIKFTDERSFRANIKIRLSVQVNCASKVDESSVYSWFAAGFFPSHREYGALYELCYKELVLLVKKNLHVQFSMLKTRPTFYSVSQTIKRLKWLFATALVSAIKWVIRQSSEYKGPIKWNHDYWLDQKPFICFILALTILGDLAWFF